MNKQELIDKAVHSYKGVWPVPVDCMTFTDWRDSFCEWVKKEEFQQRAIELGYVNGYRYGVEYPTNGKKPDLPDDVFTTIKDHDDAWETSCDEPVRNWRWQCASAFKITDQRYKPADTRYLDKPAVKESLTDDWWDYDNNKPAYDGAMPPVGTECLVEHDTSANKWFIGKVYFHDEESIVGRWLDGDNAGSLFDYSLSPDSFKPLDHATRKAEAERKRVVDSVCAAMPPSVLSGRELIEHCYDAGFLRMPEGK